MNARVAAVVSRRQVLQHVIGRDVRVKYGSSLLGYFWSILEPLMLTAVYFFVFSVIVRFQVENYALFLVCALMPWHWVQAVVGASTKALVGQSRLITKVNVPREIFPLGVVGAKTFEFLMSLLVVFVFAAVSRVAPGRYLALVPVAILLQLVLLTGVALFLSSVTVLLRDVERLTRIVLRALFYLSPIIYPVGRVLQASIPEWLKTVYGLNPLVGILSLYRAPFYPEQLPGVSVLAAAVVGPLLMFALGYWTFVRLEPAILKEL
ncbi:MAG: ABC transporter permease [Actinomycetota bacterium]|nr:ABC transporter permease [Actinomycetota bacterium]